MRFRVTYSHVPLAAAVVLLLLATLGWLVAQRSARTEPAVGLAGSEPGVVTVDADPGEPPGAAAASPGAAPTPSGESRPEGPAARPAHRRTPRPEQFTLETGPYPSPEAADQVEAQLNRLGHATVRFRTHELTRHYVVAATGFAAPDEAHEATRQIGRGTVIESGDATEVVVDRLPSLGDAVALARPLREQGFTVRVREAQTPTAVYHLRSGHFPRLAEAQALRESLARHGIHGRVVKVR